LVLPAADLPAVVLEERFFLTAMPDVSGAPRKRRIIHTLSPGGSPGEWSRNHIRIQGLAGPGEMAGAGVQRGSRYSLTTVV
jgi:hypothetical protein